MIVVIVVVVVVDVVVIVAVAVVFIIVIHTCREARCAEIVYCLCVCTVTDFSADDKASSVTFCSAVHRRPRQGITHFCEL